jgi:serine/threonine protein kinase
LPVDEVGFGRYRLLSVIGEGGMGRVYKAHDTVIGRDVDIKVLPTELGAEPGYRERFRREAHTAARLTEPHIIPIHDAGEIDGRLYLVIPIIKGIDVHELLQRDGPMSPRRAVHIIEQLAAAPDAAHAAGLVHRDIKPSNALVTGNDFVYLIDFGIAHDGAATKLTSTGMLVGTLAYMAPERFTAGRADARSDVYALACVLYECLTGATPFPGESIGQQIAGHLTLDPPRPSAHRPEVPVGFDEVIAHGMAKDPDQRYQNTTALATAAHQALTTPPSRSAARPTRPRGQLPPPPAPVPDPPYQTLAATTQQGLPGRAPVPQPHPVDRPAPQRAARSAHRVGAIAVILVIVASGRSLSSPSSPSNCSNPDTHRKPPPPHRLRYRQPPHPHPSQRQPRKPHRPRRQPRRHLSTSKLRGARAVRSIRTR